MIDTDKYERMLTDDDGWMDLLVSNLLAEVKRLQYWDEEMDRVIATLDEHSWGSSDGDVHEIVTHLLAEVKRLREQNKLMVDYFRFMRDGGFTDADWVTVNEWIGDEEE